jgi:radial spoke head protein 1
MGTLTYTTMGEYKGFWENGRRHGEGVMQYFSSGDAYSGWWRFGHKEGTGTYTFKNGEKLFGEWVESTIKTGKWIFQNGMYYVGPFENNKPNGDGEWVFPHNGNRCKGSHTQASREVENAEDPDAPPKKVFDISWSSQLSIHQSSEGINAIER